MAQKSKKTGIQIRRCCISKRRESIKLSFFTIYKYFLRFWLCVGKFLEYCSEFCFPGNQFPGSRKKFDPVIFLALFALKRAKKGQKILQETGGTLSKETFKICPKTILSCFFFMQQNYDFLNKSFLFASKHVKLDILWDTGSPCSIMVMKALGHQWLELQ